MIKSLTSAAFAGLAAAKSLGTKPSTSSMLTADNITGYNDFVGRWNKQVTDTADFNTKISIYLDNKQYVEETNNKAEGKGPDALRLELNNFSDMNEEELEKHMGLSSPDVDLDALTGFGQRLGNSLESYPAVVVDHFADGKMTGVKNQGACGSCWAFTANSVLEGTLAIKKNKKPVRLSEQQLVDCTLRGVKDKKGRQYTNGGCRGGWMATAWQYQKDNGFMTDKDYPYTSGTSKRESKCAHKPKQTIGKAMRWGNLTSVDQMLKKAKRQPLSIALAARPKAFMQYKSGIIQKQDCIGGIDHAVTVVGYTLKKRDRKGQNNYWKIQNSWGTWWGDGGFVRLNVEESGDGVCGMYKHAQFVDGRYKK